MRVLVTGVNGFVGSHLAEYILAEHPRVAVHGLKRWRSPRANIRDIEDRIILHDGDLRDLGSLIRVLKASEPDIIFHLAAQSYVMASFAYPAETMATNAGGTLNLLEAVRLTRESPWDFYQSKTDEYIFDPVVHVVSSSEVYGQVRQEDVPFTEDCPLRPVNPYGVSKAAADMAAYVYYEAYSMKTIRSRMFSHSGPRRGEVFFDSAFARQVARIELGHQEPVLRVGNLDSIRTLADVRDTVRAYWDLVTKCAHGAVYNIGGDRTMKVGDVVTMLQEMARVNFEVREDPQLMRPTDVTLQIPDTSKFREATGWEPKIPYEATLLDLLEYWRNDELAQRTRVVSRG